LITPPQYQKIIDEVFLLSGTLSVYPRLAGFLTYDDLENIKQTI